MRARCFRMYLDCASLLLGAYFPNVFNPLGITSFALTLPFRDDISTNEALWEDEAYFGSEMFNQDWTAVGTFTTSRGCGGTTE